MLYLGKVQFSFLLYNLRVILLKDVRPIEDDSEEESTELLKSHLQE